MFETTGRPEQSENFMKKHLNFGKTLTKDYKCSMWKKVSSAQKEAGRDGPINGSYQQFYFYHRDPEYILIRLNLKSLRQ